MRAILVAGLGFGDCGKGSIVDYLCRKYESKLVVRYNGGAQAAHNVVLSDRRHHCFSQWGSGTLAGAKTYLSKYMLVNPTFMLPEGEHLVSLGVTDAFERMFIDYNALVTTPFHVSLNRLRETHRRLSSTLEHGTCGMGIGETVDWANKFPSWAIRMRDFSNPNALLGKLEMLRIETLRSARELLREWPKDKNVEIDLDILEDAETSDRFISTTQELLKRGVTVVKPLDRDFLEDTIIFEGAQGVLLDEEWGFHPHTTWSDCTFGNALKLVKQFSGTKGAKVTRLGVTRPYHTRHGKGPLPSERDDLEIKDHNTTGEWQGSFRLGYFDFVMARYARFVIEGLDGIAINHLDQVNGPQKVCIAHNFQGVDMYRINFGIDHETHLGLEVMAKECEEENEPVQSVVSAVYTELGSVNRLLEAIVRVFKAPLSIIGYGPAAEDKRDV
jgi:adenylosuccinate synthase